MQKDKTNGVRKTKSGSKSMEQTSRIGRLSSQVANENNNSTSENRASTSPPTPIDFDTFMPWICREWGVPHFVTVVRASEEEDVNLEIKKIISKHLEEVKEEDDNLGERLLKTRGYTTLDFHHSIVSEGKKKYIVVIEAHYDVQNQLEAISFVECIGGIPTKVIRAVNLCLPFHSKLTRINIRKGLTQTAICDISKLIPHSNITTICLDNSVVPQGRYDILLQGTSRLSYLSMNRCEIDDNICKEIATNLIFEKPAANSLNVLELASNNITDIGAQFLGQMLRTNRRLLHLNLAGNKITDVGGKALINNLMNFPLNRDEVLEMKKKRYKSLEKNQAILKKYLEQITVYHEASDASNLSKRSSLYSSSSRTRTPRSRMSRFQDRTANFSITLGGAFLDPYAPNNLVFRDGSYFARGNFVLCSLNLAYNALHYPFLKKLDEVLSYQHSVVKFHPATGIIRIVLDGNSMPIACEEFDRITMLLKTYVDHKQPKPAEGLRQSSATSRKSIIRYSKIK